MRRSPLFVRRNSHASFFCRISLPEAKSFACSSCFFLLLAVEFPCDGEFGMGGKWVRIFPDEREHSVEVTIKVQSWAMQFRVDVDAI